MTVYVVEQSSVASQNRDKEVEETGDHMYHVLEGPTIVPGRENMAQEMKVGCEQYVNDSPILSGVSVYMSQNTLPILNSIWRDIVSIQCTSL